MSNNLAEDESPGAPGEVTECMGRTSKEWYDFLLSLGSVALIVIGALNLDNCDLIPILPTYCISFGGINLVVATIKIVWRTDRVVVAVPVLSAGGDDGQGSEQQSQHLVAPKVNPMKHVAAFLVISMSGIAIWGAVLTFPKARDYWRGGLAAEQCSVVVFTSGFLSAVIMILIFSIVILAAIGMTVLAKVRSSKQDLTPPLEESNV